MTVIPGPSDWWEIMAYKSIGSWRQWHDGKKPCIRCNLRPYFTLIVT